MILAEEMASAATEAASMAGSWRRCRFASPASALDRVLAASGRDPHWKPRA